LVVRHAQVFRDKQGINLLTGHCVEETSPDKQTVAGITADGKGFEFPYDRLMIATGSSAITPELPGFDLPGVFTLKNLDDGRKIKNFLKKNNIKKAVIIGMGYIALEMCGLSKTGWNPKESGFMPAMPSIASKPPRMGCK
jgi:NADPH-dependent 2,4-dienoyl-CoA reductase/sulfur reductase-like enzyme